MLYFMCMTFLVSAISLSSHHIVLAQSGYLGDSCTISRKTGICKFLNECQPAVDDIRNGIYPQICGFQGSRSIVCCADQQVPPKASSPIGQKSLAKCKEYSQYAYRIEEAPTLSVVPVYTKTLDCAIIYTKLIVGGTLANRKEFPHQAQLGYKPEEGNIKYSCGGSLISENFILTASHCVSDRTLGKPVKVRVGVSNQTDLVDAQVRDVVEIIKHPDYTGNKYNDIALLRVNSNFDLNPAARPACLYTKKDIPFEECIASGFGQKGFTAPQSRELLKVTVRFFTHADCDRKYNKGMIPVPIDDNSMVCAGNDHKDTCQGDSGGPIQVYHDTTEDVKCMYDIVGVTAFGKACGLEKNTPSVYTRVSNYIEWIEGIVWKD